jgi:hypothetical protein
MQGVGNFLSLAPIAPPPVLSGHKKGCHPAKITLARHRQECTSIHSRQKHTFHRLFCVSVALMSWAAIARLNLSRSAIGRGRILVNRD